MRDRLSFLIAYRYITSGIHQYNVALMVRLCFISIFISTVALTLVWGVMQGFETATYKKMQGVHAPISMRSGGKSLNVNAIQNILKKEFPQVLYSAPQTARHGMIMPQESADDVEPLLTTIIAIDPAQEKFVTNIAATLQTPSATIKDNKVIIGTKMAEQLQAQPGSVLTLLIPEEQQSNRKKISFETVELVVSGIFNTGIYEFDNSVIVCAFPFLQEIFPDSGIDQINIRPAEKVDHTTLVEALQKRFNMNVFTWRTLYPAILSALTLEKYASVCILFLIVLVACMNIIALLCMQIINKKADIALLRALGTHHTVIQHIFIIIGLYITVIASIVGLLVAALIGWWINTYKIITLPDAYYITHLPVEIDIVPMIIIWLIIVGTGIAVSWFAARNSSAIPIARTLKFEG